MEQCDYILERLKEFAMNIDEFTIAQIIIDADGEACKIINKTLNSIEVKIGKKSQMGINCSQWFSMKEFNKRFKAK